MKFSYFRPTLIAFLLTGTLAWADVTLPAIFSNHAVLQKSAKVPVWGKAEPGEKVTVTLDGQKAGAVAGADGKWSVNLNLASKAQGPFELTVEGKNKITVSDVVIGEVWVCSGQSNMEWILSNTADAANEIPNSANPMLRQFLVKKSTSPVPLEQCEGEWTLAGPETAGKFTAVGYYFGKKLQNELQVPVGLVHTSWGGTPSEAWTSIEALRTFPGVRDAVETKLTDAATFSQRIQDFQTKYAAWEAQYKRADKLPANVAVFAAPDANVSAWKKVNLPGDLAAAGLTGAGAVWVRRTVPVTLDPGQKNLRIDLPALSDFDTVYWNGEKVAETTPKSPAGGSAGTRIYYIPITVVKNGDNTLAIRIFNPNSNVSIAAAGNFKAGSVALAGEWLAKTEYTFPTPLTTEAQAAYPKQPNKLGGLQNYPAHLFNAMLNPVIPYAIEGAIWYQGESNAGRAYQYRTAFPLMINDWRTRWGQGDFSFYFCQLANFTAKKDAPGDSDWAELREAQSMTLSLPNTGQAVLIDIGEEADIHPRNKKDVGERLALIALAKNYGRKLEYSGPVYDSMKIEGDRIRVSFTHAENGLVAKPLPETYDTKTTGTFETKPLVRHAPNSPIQGFAICGEDGQWKWANARIETEREKLFWKKYTVVVWSPDVPKPVAVRYGWSNNPTCNLYNNEGLPASPFRSDDFPPVTINGKY